MLGRPKILKWKFPAVVRERDVMRGAGTEAQGQRLNITNFELWKLDQSRRIVLSPEPLEGQRPSGISISAQGSPCQNCKVCDNFYGSHRNAIRSDGGRCHLFGLVSHVLCHQDFCKSCLSVCCRVAFPLTYFLFQIQKRMACNCLSVCL